MADPAPLVAPKPSTWSLLASSRKVLLGLLVAALVLLIVTGAVVVFSVLAIRGSITPTEYLTAMTASMPVAVLALVATAWKLIGAISDEDVAKTAAGVPLPEGTTSGAPKAAP